MVMKTEVMIFICHITIWCHNPEDHNLKHCIIYDLDKYKLSHLCSMTYIWYVSLCVQMSEFTHNDVEIWM